jgi:hypothetical protein
MGQFRRLCRTRTPSNSYKASWGANEHLPGDGSGPGRVRRPATWIGVAFRPSDQPLYKQANPISTVTELLRQRATDHEIAV